MADVIESQLDEAKELCTVICSAIGRHKDGVHSIFGVARAIAWTTAYMFGGCTPEERSAIFDWVRAECDSTVDGALKKGIKPAAVIRPNVQ